MSFIINIKIIFNAISSPIFDKDGNGAGTGINSGHYRKEKQAEEKTNKNFNNNWYTLARLISFGF